MAKAKARKPAEGTAPESPAALVDRLLEEFGPRLAKGDWSGNVDDVPAGKALLTADRKTEAAAVGVILDRLADWYKDYTAYEARRGQKETAARRRESDILSNRRALLTNTLIDLRRRSLPFTEDVVLRFVELWLREEGGNLFGRGWFIYPVWEDVKRYAARNDLGPDLRAAIGRLVGTLRKRGFSEELKFADRFDTLIAGADGPAVRLEPGEAWSDAALDDLGRMKTKPRAAWEALLVHCQKGGAGKPSADWQTRAGVLIKGVGFEAFKDHVLRWFPLVDKPRTVPHVPRYQWEPDQTHLIQPPHVELLRGLAWAAGLREDADLARALARLAVSAYRKVPGKGPRLVSLGNAAVAALGIMPGQAPVGQLALLQVKVKFGTAQKEVEKAFSAAAAREGLPREEIDELAVPAYGLEDVGVLRQEFGDYRAELVVDGSAAAVRWSKDGKPLKSAPAALKQSHPAELKELQGTLKDVNAMLPAQRERIDALYLARKTWPLATWRERYLDHPLVGTIARRLIWTFTSGGKAADGFWLDGALVGLNGKPLAVRDDATVSLWHPIDRPADEVLTWRDFLERREVVQPFKQAHREVYRLTDAERQTGTYSNRFAAHILKQHQFHALCAARGWKNRLRLMVDADYPPAFRPLPAWGLRAEFWVEGAGTEVGRDTADSGAYLYLATDQVRFYRQDAPQLVAHAGGGGYGRYAGRADDPLPLADVPPLVLSEVMRDVDLFVGVAGVGNDPNWADGGPGGRHRDYWERYSFGELSATAQTRKALLERLVPRLKIADRCSLTDRFLVVRGDLRTYKIHLGSGNILMAPNDQYLCIVPRQTIAGADRVFLPFEGDGTLATILSKVFLLAGDTKITDPTILSQLQR